MLVRVLKRGKPGDYGSFNQMNTLSINRINGILSIVGQRNKMQTLDMIRQCLYSPFIFWTLLALSSARRFHFNSGPGVELSHQNKLANTGNRTRITSFPIESEMFLLMNDEELPKYTTQIVQKLQCNRCKCIWYNMFIRRMLHGNHWRTTVWRVRDGVIKWIQLYWNEDNRILLCFRVIFSTKIGSDLVLRNYYIKF